MSRLGNAKKLNTDSFVTQSGMTYTEYIANKEAMEQGETSKAKRDFKKAYKQYEKAQAGGGESGYWDDLVEGFKTLGSATKNAASILIDASGQFFSSAYNWLSTALSSPTGHKLKIVTSAYSMGTNAVTGIRRFASTQGGAAGVIMGIATGTLIADKLSSLTNMLSGGLTSSRFNGASQEIFQGINAILDELKNPNVDGIPIHATKEVLSQDIEVGEQVVIVQDSASKEVCVDNVVPKLRQFSVQGYLMANQLTLVDPYLVLKPSLQLQKRVLQAYANSRKPVWYKTGDNEFIVCLIKHIETGRTEKGLNAIEISMQLQEFKVWYTESTVRSPTKGKSVSSIGA